MPPGLDFDDVFWAPVLSGCIPILPEKGAFSFKCPPLPTSWASVSNSPAGADDRGLLRELWYLLDSSNISLRTRWLKTANNLAGALSRIRDPSACQLRPALFRRLDVLWGPQRTPFFLGDGHAAAPLQLALPGPSLEGGRQHAGAVVGRYAQLGPHAAAGPGGSRLFSTLHWRGGHRPGPLVAVRPLVPGPDGPRLRPLAAAAFWLVASRRPPMGVAGRPTVCTAGGLPRSGGPPNTAAASTTVAPPPLLSGGRSGLLSLTASGRPHRLGISSGAADAASAAPSPLVRGALACSPSLSRGALVALGPPWAPDARPSSLTRFIARSLARWSRGSGWCAVCGAPGLGPSLCLTGRHSARSFHALPQAFVDIVLWGELRWLRLVL